MILRMPTMLYAMFGKGYLPNKIEGSMTTMPADFLIDAAGVIRRAYYGKDEGDHLPFEEVKQFALHAHHSPTDMKGTSNDECIARR